MKYNYYRHINGVPYKMHFFIEMQFAAYFYTVVPYQALFRLPIYKKSAISKSGAIFCHFARYAISVPQLYVYYTWLYIMSYCMGVTSLIRNRVWSSLDIGSCKRGDQKFEQ